MKFADHFSTASRDYSRFRPVYPAKLYHWLAGLAPGLDLAWDCATGNGQAARGLKAHFRQVVATDASAEQIASADVHQGIRFRVAPAQRSGLQGGSVDLVAVAQALHWFADESFYAEVRRVLRPGGVLAAWGYGLTRVDAAVDPLVDAFYGNRLDAFWPPERVHVEAAYRDLDFPFEELANTPNLSIEADMKVEDFLGYLGTWSAVKRLRAAQGGDPIADLAAQMRPV